MFEETKGVIGNRKQKKDRQSMDQDKMDKSANNDLQNPTQKTEDQARGTQLKLPVTLVLFVLQKRR